MNGGFGLGFRFVAHETWFSLLITRIGSIGSFRAGRVLSCRDTFCILIPLVTYELHCEAS